ncbi:hypothetical protein ACHAWF_002125 [Thalassiosira exigua]
MRCVLKLNPTSDLHVSKSTRKKSKKFLLSVNECFDRVVAGCHEQHGMNWLYPQIVDAFRAIHQRTIGESAGTSPVRLYSVEIWNADTGALAGGELGYSVGGIYSSLTGFSDEDAAGSSQLVALGRLLTRCGFEYWDLGMDLDYKRRLGARLMRRADFVDEVKRSRIEKKGVSLRCEERKNAKELVDWNPVTAATETTQNVSRKEENGRKHPPSEDGTKQLEPCRKRQHEEGNEP